MPHPKRSSLSFGGPHSSLALALRWLAESDRTCSLPLRGVSSYYLCSTLSSPFLFTDVLAQSGLTEASVQMMSQLVSCGPLELASATQPCSASSVHGSPFQQVHYRLWCCQGARFTYGMQVHLVVFLCVYMCHNCPVLVVDCLSTL